METERIGQAPSSEIISNGRCVEDKALDNVFQERLREAVDPIAESIIMDLIDNMPEEERTKIVRKAKRLRSLGIKGNREQVLRMAHRKYWEEKQNES